MTDEPRYDAYDLRRAVDDLTLPTHLPVTQVVNGTTYKRRVEHPPLLVQLEAAIHSTMVGGGGAGRSEPWTVVPLDGDALYQFTIISSQITDWCRMAGAGRHGHPVDGLRAWHAATLATLTEPHWHVTQLRQWAGLIRSKLNPRRRRDLPDPCPECQATTWADEDGNSGLRPLVVSFQPDSPDVLATASVTCRACGSEWRGITAVRAVAYELERSHT